MNPDVQPLVDLGGHTGRHEGSRIELIDHGRPLEHRPRRERTPVVDRRGDWALELVEMDRPCPEPPMARTFRR